MEDKPKKQGIPFASLFDQIDKSSEASIYKPLPQSQDTQKEASQELSSDEEILSKGADYAETVYRKLLALADDLLYSNLSIGLEHIDQIRELIKEAIPLAESGEQDLVECVFNTHFINNVDYALLNIVNVTVLSLELAVFLGYTSHSLERLGVAAFLHDLGMKVFNDLVKLPRELENEERRSIEDHPLEGAAMLRALNDDFASSIAEVIIQEHERIDGSGYPKGLQKGEISEYAQIIGLVDVYEALTHQRPQRKSFSPLGALKNIIESDKAFSSRLIKVLIEKIGLYPRGTFVELNTKEIALVVGQNVRIPSCPLVKVIYDSHGDKTEQRRKIDLSKGTRIFIIRCI